MLNSISLPQTQSERDDDVLALITPAFADAEQTMTIFDIIGIDKPLLLMTLFNNAKKVEDHWYSDDMDIWFATRIINGYEACGTYPPLTDFTGPADGGCEDGGVDERGVFMGRILAVDLSGDELDTEGYDRVNGDGKGRHVYYTVLAAIESGITPQIESGSRY